MSYPNVIGRDLKRDFIEGIEIYGRRRYNSSERYSVFSVYGVYNYEKCGNYKNN